MNIRDTISGIVCLLISAFVMATSVRLDVGALHEPGPGFMLFWAAVLLAVCSVILFCSSLFNKAGTLRGADSPDAPDRPDVPDRPDRAKVVIAVVALVAYCLAVPWLGYRAATFMLMLVLFGLGRMKPWAVVLGSLVTVLASYYLFGQLLRTPLPRGMLDF